MRGMGWAFVFAIAAPSCRQQTPNLNGLACAGTQCLAGYVCDPVSTLCVVQPVVGCETSAQLCPTTVATGGACGLAGFQLPCTTDSTSCAAGDCRMCQNDHTWSSCSAIGGTSAGSSTGGSSAGSTGLVAPPGAILVVTSGSGQAFGKGARAMSIGQPLVGNSQNSGGQVTFGFAATVQP